MGCEAGIDWAIRTSPPRLSRTPAKEARLITMPTEYAHKRADVNRVDGRPAPVPSSPLREMTAGASMSFLIARPSVVLETSRASHSCEREDVVHVLSFDVEWCGPPARPGRPTPKVCYLPMTSSRSLRAVLTSGISKSVMAAIHFAKEWSPRSRSWRYRFVASSRRMSS